MSSYRSYDFSLKVPCIPCRIITCHRAGQPLHGMRTQLVLALRACMRTSSERRPVLPDQDTELDREERQLGMQEAASRQRWRWALVACIAIVVACLSMLLNTCIGWLNLARIHATERVITSRGGHRTSLPP